MIELYSDGGTVGPNPSKIGGVWAWVATRNGQFLKEKSGFITPTNVNLPCVTNNVAELYAAVLVLEEKWEGPLTLCTDSFVTHCRLKGSSARVGVPDWLWNRLRSVRLSVNYRSKLIAGHPSEDDLRLGHVQRRKRSFPVSAWNVRADALCVSEADRRSICCSVMD